MKILHISALWLWAMDGKGGMPSLLETVSGHTRAGHEVVLILPKYDLFSDKLMEYPDREEDVCEVHVAQCTWHRIVKPLRSFAQSFNRRKETPYLIRWLLNLTIALLLTFSLLLKSVHVRYRYHKNFDLVYAHNQYAALAGWILGIVFRVPNVTRLYGTFLADLMKRRFVGLRYPVATAGFLIPHSLLICANDGTRGDEVAHLLKIDISRFRFWQNGVNFPEIEEELTREELGKKFPSVNLNADCKLFLSCSRLSNWKRIDRMFHALSCCCHSGCNCQLLIAGDGPEREKLEQLASDLEIHKYVVWLGAVAHDDVWALMKLVDAFIITNDVTNRCNPLYEAIRVALPVVSVIDPSTRDLLIHGENALLAEKDDSRTLGHYLTELCNQAGLIEKMSRAQYVRSKELWTWKERMAVEVGELEALVRK